MTRSGTCSIVVPSRDRRDRLRRTLSTLVAQRYPHIEIIVSDDGSTDGTSEMVEAMSDPRVRVVRSETSTGVSNARNRGIEAATGRWVAVCDDDDLWHPDKISTQVDLLTQTGRKWSCTSAVHVRDDFSMLHVTPPIDDDYIRSEIAHGNPIPGGCSSVVFVRDLLDRIGGFDPSFSMFADWDLWLRSYDADGPPAACDLFGVLYLVHDEQMSAELWSLTGELARIRLKNSALRTRLGTPPIDSVDYWAMVTLRRAGRWRDAYRHAWSGAAGRGPMALRWSLNALTARLGAQGLPEPTTDEERDRQSRAARAVHEVRASLETST